MGDLLNFEKCLASKASDTVESVWIRRLLIILIKMAVKTDGGRAQVASSSLRVT